MPESSLILPRFRKRTCGGKQSFLTPRIIVERRKCPGKAPRDMARDKSQRGLTKVADSQPRTLRIAADRVASQTSAIHRPGASEREEKQKYKS
jgi:hypothetical protein